MKQPLHKPNDVFDGLHERTTQMASLAGPIGKNTEIANLRQRLCDQDRKHKDVITEIHGILDELELLQNQYVGHRLWPLPLINIKKEVEREVTEQVDKLVQERVAECLKTYIPQELQDGVTKNNREPSQNQPHLSSQLPHTMSHRNPPSALQGPSTPIPSHTITSPVHPPCPSALAHSSNSLSLTSPPPTSSIPSLSHAKHLDVGSRTSVPRRPTSIRTETEDQLAEQEQNDTLKAEAVKVADEIRKLEEGAWLENEQKERRRLEEERLRKEAEDLKLQRLREEERKLRLKQERILKKQEEEKALRLAQERAKEEKERKEKEERQEQERLLKLAEEARLRLEEEAATKAVAEANSEPEPEEREEAELEAHKGKGRQDEQLEDGNTETSKSMEDGKYKPKDGLRINTIAINSPMSDRRRPGPLDLTGAIRSASPVVAALATARFIADITAVPYPEGFQGPHPDLNQNVKNGKFRYDPDFLLQFMSVCRERPAALPPLDTIGLEPVDHTHAMFRGGSGHLHSGAALPSPQASIGLGFTPSALGKSGANNLFSMGNFGTMGTGSKLSNEAAPVSGAPGMQYTSNEPSTMQGSATSQGGARAPLQKGVRAKRKDIRNENNTIPSGSGGQGHGSGFDNNMNQMQNLDPVVPLQASENRWDRKAIKAEQDSPELVERKVKGLLNKLTMEKFGSISDQIIAWANKSENEKDGFTLIQVIRLVFEKATDESTWSEMYARLCRKMMEKISTNVQDDSIRNAKGVTGGQLFRKYLLNRCQEDFERGWGAKEVTAAAAAIKVLEDEAIKTANSKIKEGGTEGIIQYSDEYYAAQKVKRQGAGLIKFLGELFKLQMLTERIMHECVKLLLGVVDKPEEEEIESLCKLLGAIGSMLDIQKARGHLDVYFSRMKELMKNPNVAPRFQYMIQDLVELRERKWVARNDVAAPTTIAKIHEDAAKAKAAQEESFYQRQISMSRGASSRSDDCSEFYSPQQVGPDGISHTNLSSNMFSMVSSQGAEAGDKDKVPTATAESLPQGRSLVLQPRPLTVDVTSPATESESSHSEEEASIEMTEAALKKISEDLKGFFAVRNLEEAEVYFSSLPPQHHHLLVDKIVSTAVESKEDDAKLVSQFFAIASSKGLCSAASFEEGLTPVAEIIDDIAIDAPKAFQLLAMMVKGANLNQERLSNLASRSLDSDKFLALLQ